MQRKRITKIENLQLGFFSLYFDYSIYSLMWYILIENINGKNSINFKLKIIFENNK